MPLASRVIRADSVAVSAELAVEDCRMRLHGSRVERDNERPMIAICNVHGKGRSRAPST